MKKKILILENSVATTGAMQSIVQSCALLQDRFDFVFVFPAGSRCVASIRALGFDVYELPMKELSRKPLSWTLYIPALLTNVFRLRRILKTTGTQLIHGNDLYNLLPACYRMLGGKIPYVCHIRFLPARFPRMLSQLFFFVHAKMAEKIIAVSEAVKTQIPLNEKVVVIHDGLPASGKEMPFSYDTNARLILYLANYIQGKGQDHALQAFAEIHAAYPEWKLRFAGGDMGLEKNKVFKAQLKKMAIRLGIGNQTEFSGFAEDTEKEYMQSAVVLNFSDSESFSMTCLEALYFGRPVIATLSGGPAEIITNGVTGLLVPVQNIPSMKEALLHLLPDHTMRQAMAAAAYASARNKFGRQQLRDKLLAVYLPLMQKYSGN